MKHRHRLFPIVLSVLGAAAWSGCAGEGPAALSSGKEPEPDPPQTRTVDFERDVQPIFDASCSCHLLLNAPEGAVLLAGASYDSLVDVPSTQDPSLLRVKPGDPDGSYLVIKIDDTVPDVATHRVGGRMPLDLPPLSTGDIATIRRWIEEGAARRVEEPEPDTQPPAFGGAVSAVAAGPTEIDVSWKPASDDRTARERLLYRVFRALASGAHDFASAAAEVRGATTARIGGLEAGTEYFFVVRVEDEAGNSDANSLEVSATTDPAPGDFRRGDVGGDGEVDLADAVSLLGFLFQAGPPPVCLPAADTNDDETLDIADAIFLLDHLFLGGEPLPSLSAAEVAACEGKRDDAVERGMAVYNQPDPRGNLYSCATCHAVEPDEEAEIIRAGHSLHDALRRPSFKLGRVATFREAVNICRVHWMAASPWEEADPSYQDLVAFLESVSPPDPAPPLVFEIVAPAVTGPPTGDPIAGCRLFARSCIVCHGPGGEGSALAPSLVAFRLGANFIRRKVRLSGPRGTVYDGLTGGRMPFWSRDKLSDAELEDLASYLEARPIPECEEEAP